jgi:quinol monooxygenase YgiN
VFFISHFAVKEDKLEDLKRLVAEMGAQLEAEKSRTFAYLMYLDESGTQLTIVHGFPDADAMDVHFEGSHERSAVAYELIEPRGWEIYGRASDGALEGMRREAAASGVPLTVRSEPVGGYLRAETQRTVGRSFDHSQPFG